MLACGGGGGPGTGEEVDAKDAKANQEAAKSMDASENADKKIIKLLLLGAGESGKSTIFKQMKVINKNGYSDAEKKTFQSIVWSNTIVSLKALLDAFEKLGVDKPDDVIGWEKEFVDMTEAQDEKLCPASGALLKQIWANPAIKIVFERRNEFQLNDSAEYYFEAIDRISVENYLPTTDDVLRSRVRTTGIVQSDFKIKATNFSMFDVGGQRNERRKWIHCFDHVTAVCFVAALSEFDQVLYEDETQNRLDEAVDLFKQISNSKWFKQTEIILFLNKKDLFEMKLEKKKFADYKSEYSGENKLEPCAEFCKELFLKQRPFKEGVTKFIYSHVTTATDTKNVAFVFNAVVSMILDKNMKESGLM
jgi:GTPase SAR1 family protein